VLSGWLDRDFTGEILRNPEYDGSDALGDIEQARRTVAGLSAAAAGAAEDPEGGSMRNLIERIGSRLARAESEVRHLQAGLALAQTHAAGVDGVRRIGFGSVPDRDALTALLRYGDVVVSTGPVRDGESAARVTEYLRNQARSHNGNGGGLATFADAPIVNTARGTGKTLTALAERAVAIVNASLPGDRQIRIRTSRAPAGQDLDGVADGRIVLDFSLEGSSGYRYRYDPIWEYNDAAGRWERRGMRAAVISLNGKRYLNTAWVRDPDTGTARRRQLDSPVVETGLVRRAYPDDRVVRAIAESLLRVMGFPEQPDADRFADSLFAGAPEHFHRLPAIEGDALLAAYGRLGPGTRPERLSAASLGPWNNVSFHVHGDLKPANGQEAAFGVSRRNGLTRPWAYGPEPLATLADNSALYGTVAWQGALAGITPDAAVVHGSMHATVELATLEGQLDFDGLELADGTAWGDGSLNYAFRVRDNALIPTGGDGGTLVGSFLGRAHEAVGGVLLRDDLAAGFGGVRE